MSKPFPRGAYSPRGMLLKPHRHGFYEAMWIMQGRAACTDRRGSSLCSGWAHLHVPGALHLWQALTTVRRLVIWFSLANPPPCAAPPRHPFRTDAVADLFREAQNAGPGRGDRLTARITLLIAPLLDGLDWPGAEHPDHDEEINEPVSITRVDRFLEENLAQPIRLQDVAHHLHMSVPTLTRLVRRETGESLMRRLQALRMRRASQLLQQGNVSVKEVGAWVGLPEPSYFYRCFQRHFGRTPGAWRRHAGVDAAMTDGVKA
ncbi:MAG: AraC family transcriptional regulator [Lentisphaerae bacterium]|nr:AraC family transcriptional regulator [Lentisphaerota bacterium]